MTFLGGETMGAGLVELADNQGKMVDTLLDNR
jgi:hypothetical protein